MRRERSPGVAVVQSLLAVPSRLHVALEVGIRVIGRRVFVGANVLAVALEIVAGLVSGGLVVGANVLALALEVRLLRGALCVLLHIRHCDPLSKDSGVITPI
jgi:hypothetical protein